MKRWKPIAMLALMGASLGCAQVASLRPLVKADDPQEVFEPALVGKWDWDVQITQDDKPGYKVRIGDGKEGSLHLIRIDGLLLGDYCPPTDGGVPVHAFLKIEIGRDQLQVSLLGSKWMADQLKKYGYPRFELLDGEADDDLLLTASTDEMRRDLTPYFFDDRAVDEKFTLKRVSKADTEERRPLK